MILVFRKTGQRRYAVEVERDNLVKLEMNPAPGYDPVAPHDLLHLVVEANLGLTTAVFGQLASGGDASTFHLSSISGRSDREATRLRRRLQKRGATLARAGIEESAQSERAAYVCWQVWLSRSTIQKRNILGQSMAAQAREIRRRMSTDESHTLDGALNRTCFHLDELSSKWLTLEIGESLSVHWPDLTLVEKN